MKAIIHDIAAETIYAVNNLSECRSRLDALAYELLLSLNRGDQTEHAVTIGNTIAELAPCDRKRSICGRADYSHLAHLADPGRGDDVLSAAQTASVEQQAMLAAAPIEQAYQASLTSYIKKKEGQVEWLESRLEAMIEQQEARLQWAQTNSPGVLARSSTKRTWQAIQVGLQARLQTLHKRLDVVREIKGGMGVRAPRIEELATRKMRAENPELATSWQAMREAARRGELCRKGIDKKKGRAQFRSHPLQRAVGLSHFLQL